MIDDHDRCEWVNVSSGIGSPGFPGENSHSWKTVCVHACVRACLAMVCEQDYPKN